MRLKMIRETTWPLTSNPALPKSLFDLHWDYYHTLTECTTLNITFPPGGVNFLLHNVQIHQS